MTDYEILHSRRRVHHEADVFLAFGQRICGFGIVSMLLFCRPKSHSMKIAVWMMILLGYLGATVRAFSVSHQQLGRPLSAVRHRSPIPPRSSVQVPNRNLRSSSLDSTTTDNEVPRIGDDSAYFSLQDQSLEDWAKFTVATSVVLAAVAYVWVLPFGLHGGDAFLQWTQATIGTTDPAITVAAMLSVFAVCHSGLAGLRTYAEPLIGPRPWRVIFAVVSLPLALSCISYFVNHAHDGVQYWDASHIPGIHTALYVTNFISFLFLYPSTFNLLEIAAIEQPQLHLWETGIIRITRHPQAIGQIMWCAAHTLWLGTSTAIAASTILVAHHVFSMYHGDRRLQTRHGAEKFAALQERTSIVPFAAILDGRQKLPPDYYKEFLRLPYAVVIGGTMAAYVAHPYMQAGAALLHW